MKALLFVIICVAAWDVIFNHGATVLACWAMLSELVATIRRGIWASP